MKIKSEEIKNKIKNKIVALATSSRDGQPHNIAVEVNDIKKNKIIITDNYMQKTKDNLKANSRIALAFWEGKKGFNIEGSAKYYDSGKWLEFVKSLKENKGYPAKGVIVIDIQNIKEL